VSWIAPAVISEAEAEPWSTSTTIGKSTNFFSSEAK
jgi:hypothetical protein